MALECRLHDAALHASAPPVNETNLAEPSGSRRVDVLLDHRRDVPGKERMEVQFGLDPLNGAGPDGAICVGSPETVAKKIAANIQALGLSRFDMKFSNGTLPHDKMMASIELYGTKVQPRVRELLEIAGYRPGAFTLQTQS